MIILGPFIINSVKSTVLLSNGSVPETKSTSASCQIIIGGVEVDQAAVVQAGGVVALAGLSCSQNAGVLMAPKASLVMA